MTSTHSISRGALGISRLHPKSWPTVRARPLAGILLFSDGNATDIESLNDGLGQMPPVYPVVMGKQSPIKDISIASVQVTSSTFEDAPVVIHCQLAATDFPAEKIVARLLDADGKVLDTNTPRLARR